MCKWGLCCELFPDLMGCNGYHLVPLAMVQFTREPGNLTAVAEALILLRSQELYRNKALEKNRGTQLFVFDQMRG